MGKSSFFAAGLIIGILLGGSAAWIYSNRINDQKRSAAESQLREEVAEKLEDSGFLVPEDLVEQSEEVSGEIIEIGSDFIVIETDLQRRDPFAQPIPKNRIVTITDSTQISLVTEKDPTIIDEEIQAWQAIIDDFDPDADAEPQELPEPPQPFGEVAILANELQVGDLVSVLADEDIFSKERFDAARVIVNDRFEEGDDEEFQEPVAPEDPEQEN